MRPYITATFGVLLLAFAGSSTPLFAQATTGTISGAVTDDTKRSLLARRCR